MRSDFSRAFPSPVIPEGTILDNFADETLWVPQHYPAQLTVSFPNGKLQINQAGPAAAGAENDIYYAGVMGRFRIFPSKDPASLGQISLKFRYENVSWSALVGATNQWTFGCNFSSINMTYGAVCGIWAGTASVSLMDIAYGVYTARTAAGTFAMSKFGATGLASPLPLGFMEVNFDFNAGTAPKELLADTDGGGLRFSVTGGAPWTDCGADTIGGPSIMEGIGLHVGFYTRNKNVFQGTIASVTVQKGFLVL